MSKSAHDLHRLVEKTEAEHKLLARECEARWCNELEERRRVLAAECKLILERIRDAS